MPPTASNARGSRRRPRHDPKETEREILDAAEQLLRERPFRDITVEQVMLRTELKRPAFYAHFRDRHDLMLRVGQRLATEVFGVASRWLEGDNPLQDARTALEGIVAVYVDHGPVFRALSEAAVSDAELERAYHQFLQAFIDPTARHIRADQAAGRVPADLDPDETARALVWLNDRYLAQALGRERRTDPAIVLNTLVRVWITTLYAPAQAEIA